MAGAVSGRVVRRKDKSLEDSITSRCCRKVLCLVVEEHRRETYIEEVKRSGLQRAKGS